MSPIKRNDRARGLVRIFKKNAIQSTIIKFHYQNSIKHTNGLHGLRRPLYDRSLASIVLSRRNLISVANDRLPVRGACNHPLAVIFPRSLSEREIFARQVDAGNCALSRRHVDRTNSSPISRVPTC